MCFDVVCLFFRYLVREAIRQQYVAVQNPALKLLASSLPDCIKHSKAKNTQVKYYRGFDRWRSWASKFTEVNVLPACSIYIALQNIVRRYAKYSVVSPGLYSFFLHS